MAATSARFAVTDILPLFDRRSALLYGLIGVLAALNCALIVAGGWSIQLPWLLDRPLWAGVAVLIAAMLRRAGRIRTAAFIETSILLYLQGGVALLFLLLLLPASAQLADAHLAAADAVLGFHWPSFVAFVAAHDWLGHVMARCYHSFDWQGPLVLLVLARTAQFERAWRFVASALVCLILSAPIFLLLPAADAASYFGGSTPADLAPKVAILGIQAGIRVIDQSNFIGVMTIPSFHASAAFLFAWAAWRTPLRWPIALLNVAMSVSAIVVGSHYLIDIVVGGLIGFTATQVVAYMHWVLPELAPLPPAVAAGPSE